MCTIRVRGNQELRSVRDTDKFSCLFEMFCFNGLVELDQSIVLAPFPRSLILLHGSLYIELSCSDKTSDVTRSAFIGTWI